MNKKILIAVIACVLLIAAGIIAAAGRNFSEKRIDAVEKKAVDAVLMIINDSEKIAEIIEEDTTEVIETTEEAVETTEVAVETTEEIIETTEAPELTEAVTEAVTQAPVENIEESNAVADTGLPFDIASLATAAQTNQIVMAVGDGSLTGCVVYLFEKGDDSVWRMTLETPGFWGKNGISYHTIEGDKTTPAGSFDLGLAFGNYANPGTAMEWVDVNPYMYWIDDVNSDYYNLLIDSREVPDGWSSGEHLVDIMPDYAYSINIEVNPERRKDSTSAIFLHCGSGPTAGCVAVPENCMVTILQRLKPGAKMIIAENASTVSLY